MDTGKYDKIFVGMSGGKDSTSLALWVRFESGWPLEKLIFGFMDTENEDSLTYEYLRYVSSVLHPYKIQRYDPGVGFYELCRKKHRFPATKSRFCTEELKIKPKHRLFAQMIEDGITPLNCTGVRTAEAHSSNDRGDAKYFDFEIYKLSATERTELLLGVSRKDPEFIEWKDFFEPQAYFIDVCRPIVDWSIEQVWDIHKRYLSLDAVVSIVEQDDEIQHKDKIIKTLTGNGIPHNPLYAMGASRVGCYPCINSRKEEIRSIDRYRPTRIDYVRWMETYCGELRKGANISTFFPSDKTPKRFCSKRIVANDGSIHFVPTIDDVVKWSWTADRAAEMEQLNLYSEDQPTACQIGGHCE